MKTAIPYIFLAGMLMVAGCQQQAGQRDAQPAADNVDASTVVIGVAAPFTQNSAAFGEQVRMSLSIALDQANAAGGVDGKKIVLNMQDDAGKADDAQKVATKLASDPTVLAVVGHFNSQCTLAAKEIYAQAQLVSVSPASTAVNVTHDSDYVYRNIFTDDFQGQSLATYVASLGHRKVAILFDNDDYGTGLKDSFSKKASELGLDAKNAQAFDVSTTDFRAQLTGANASAPDIILIAGLYTQAANIVKQAREIGMKAPFIGGEGLFSEKFVELAGDAAEGTLISSPFLFDLAGEDGREYASEFRDRYGRDPDTWAALTYDAFNIIVKALREKGASRAAVLEYVKSLNSPENAFDGLTGRTYFDAEGDCRKPVQMAVVRRGKFVAAEKQLEGAGVSDSLTSGSAAQTVSTTSAASLTTGTDVR